MRRPGWIYHSSVNAANTPFYGKSSVSTGLLFSGWGVHVIYFNDMKWPVVAMANARYGPSLISRSVDCWNDQSGITLALLSKPSTLITLFGDSTITNFYKNLSDLRSMIL